MLKTGCSELFLSKLQKRPFHKLPLFLIWKFGPFKHTFWLATQRSSYAGLSSIGTGPMRLNPIMSMMQPINVTTLAGTNLSHSQPHHGAVNAYVPPFITNINPNTIGDKLNCKHVETIKLYYYIIYFLWILKRTII